MDSLLKRHALKHLIIDNVVFVGGTTKMPIIRDYIQSKFKLTEIQNIGDNSDDFLCVSKGAAIYSALMSQTVFPPFGKNITRIDFMTRIPHNLYIEKYDKTLDKIIREGMACPAVSVHTYLPTNLSADKKYVQLSKINVFQDRDGNKPLCIGYLDLSKDKIYAHGRDVNHIPIKIKIIADATLVKVKMTVSEGNRDKTNYSVEKYIEL